MLLREYSSQNHNVCSLLLEQQFLGLQVPRATKAEHQGMGPKNLHLNQFAQ